MVNISYIRLLQAIESFASAHRQVQKFASDFPAQMPNFATKDEAYPILFVSPTNTIFDRNATTFQFDVFCFDIIQKDRENISTILSDTNLILSDLNLWLVEDNVFGIDVISTSTATPIDNALLDYAAGWRMTLIVDVSRYNVCDIPFDVAPSGITEVNNIVYSQWLTCETLENCPIIEDILEDILELSGNTITCDTISECPIIIDIIEDILELSGNTLTCDTIADCPVIVDIIEDILELSGQTLTGAYIPLTGTTSGATLTGNIEVTPPVSGITGFSAFVDDKTSMIGMDINGNGSMYVENSNGFTNNSFTPNGHIIETNNPLAFGIQGSFDFSNAYPTNKLIYTQRHYVDDAISASISGFSTTDIRVTGATYSNGTAIFTNNTGGTFSLTGLFTGSTDVRVTGGTYNNTTGVASFTNNTGGTFNVSGFYTGYTAPIDVRVTGATYSAGTLQFTNNTGGTFNVNGLYTGSTSGLTGFGIEGYLPKYGVSGLTLINSSVYQPPASPSTAINYAGRAFVYGTTILSIQRGQSQLDIALGNPDTGQDSHLVSDNIFGLNIQSGGDLAFGTGTGYTEVLRLDIAGQLKIIQTPITGVNTDMVLVRNTATGFVRQIPSSSIIGTTVTGGTYSNGTAIFTNSSGGTFNVTGFYTGATDVRVTGGTYSAGTIQFINNTGGTFNVTGLYTGYTAPTDIRVTGGTYTASAGTASYLNSTGGTFNVTGFTDNTQITLYNINTDSAAVTGTTGQTLVYTFLIPANTFAAGDSFYIDLMGRRTVIGSGSLVTLRTNSTGTFSTSATILGSSSSFNSQTIIPIIRTYRVKDASTIEVVNPNNTGNGFGVLVSDGLNNVSFNTTINNYIYVSATPSTVSDSVIISGIRITKIKSRTII